MGKNAPADPKEVVTFRLTKTQLDDLDEIADRESRSRSSVLVRLVKEAIKSGSSSFFATEYSNLGEVFKKEQLPHDN